MSWNIHKKNNISLQRKMLQAHRQYARIYVDITAAKKLNNKFLEILKRTHSYTFLTQISPDEISST